MQHEVANALHDVGLKGVVKAQIFWLQVGHEFLLGRELRFAGHSKA